MMYDIPPIPHDSHDQSRWHEQGRRWRMLHGQWAGDARAMQTRAMGLIRADAHGEPDLSSNVMLDICNQIGIHYNDGVTITREVDDVEDVESAAIMSKALDKAGHAAIMQTAVIDLIGIREMLIRVSQRADGSIMLRPVYPHTVIAYSEPDAPDVPVTIEEMRHRKVDGKACWTWDVLDVCDPANPTYRVFLDGGPGGQRLDITEQVLGSRYDGDAYPYRVDGVPILPYAMYHARVWPQLWGYMDRIEVVEGTLRSAVYWTFLGHVLRNAAFVQRVAIDLELPTSEVNGPNSKRQEFVADPAAVLFLNTRNDNDTPSPQGGRIDSWVSPADPQVMFETAVSYDRKVASAFGVSASDFSRETGDPRSAYALIISNAGKITAARSYTGGIERGDLQLLRIVAGLLDLPGDGWEIDYLAVPEAVVMSGTPEAETPDAGDPADPAIEQGQPDAASTVPPDAGAPLAATALNGAQVQAAAEIVQAVAEGALPRDSGVAMLIKFFQLSPADAEEIMGSVGKGFTPAEPVQSEGSA